MAIVGFVETLLGGLDANVRKVLTEVFRYTVPNNRVGPVEHQAKSENFAGYHLMSTTSDSTSEFSVAHGLSRTPYLAVPTLDLTAVGAKFPRLEVTRAADDQRVYFKSQDTSAPFSVVVE